MTDPSLDRAKWKELGLEGTSRMARSHEDKRVQLRRNKVSFPALTFEVSFFATANQGACIYYQTEFSNCGKRYFPKEVIKERKKNSGILNVQTFHPTPSVEPLYHLKARHEIPST